MDNELLNEFIVEAKGHLAVIEAGLLHLEAAEGDDDTVNGIFRAAHSIKGTASFFGLNKIVELAHIIENLFGELREQRLTAGTEMVDALLAAADALKEMIDSPAGSEQYDIAGHASALRRFMAGGQSGAARQSEPRGGLSAWDLWNKLTGEEQETEPAQPAPTAAAAQPAVRSAAAGGPPDAARDDGKAREVVMDDRVRVSVSLLNNLLNLAGEMVLRRNQLLRISHEVAGQAPLMEAVAKGIDELTTNLQKTVMKTRMQPIASVFNKFPRIVRDLSRKVGKEVDLTMQGMEVELDRSLVEALVDPLTHLVRNSLDHGIESPDKRAEHDKPPAGALVLRAYHESGRVIVDVCDDGAGIDLEKVKAKAVQRGIAGEKEVAAMSEADIVGLIMTPGFSTAEKVTDISGRGVGLDVVKTNIEKLGGKIEVISEAGRGTTFRLILPLTLAIISAFIVIAGNQAFAIPQANVRELLLIQPGESGRKVEMVQGNPVLRLRGRILPLVRLEDLLAGENRPGGDAAGQYFSGERTLRVLVIKAGNTAYGLVVDSVYDTEEILVKPLPPIIGGCGAYSGVTVLGDGSIALILDTESLRQRAGISLDEDGQLPAAANAAKPVDREMQYLLLFKCSGGELLGLDMAMVARVEKIDVSRLQKVGAKYYFSFQGQTTRVIRPEHYLPLARRKNKPATVYVVLPKLVKFPIGIIAEEIDDAVYTTVSMDEGGVAGKGILGSALIDGKLVTLINIHELFAKAASEYYSRGAGRKRAGGGDGLSRTEEDRKAKILLAEDSPFFLRVVKSYLESEGYEVVTAENGREALERLHQIKVDLVVSDIEMPLMNGIELVRAIRANPALRELPAIALTSLTDDKNREKGLRAGFDLYEHKLDRTRLLEKISGILPAKA